MRDARNRYVFLRDSIHVSNLDTTYFTHWCQRCEEITASCSFDKNSIIQAELDKTHCLC